MKKQKPSGRLFLLNVVDFFVDLLVRIVLFAGILVFWYLIFLNVKYSKIYPKVVLEKDPFTIKKMFNKDVFIFQGLKEPIHRDSTKLEKGKGPDFINPKSIEGAASSEEAGVPTLNTEKKEISKRLVSATLFRDTVSEEGFDENLAEILYRDIRLKIPAEIRSNKYLYQLNVVRVKKSDAKIKLSFNLITESSELLEISDINEVLKGVSKGVIAFVKISNSPSDRTLILNVRSKINIFKDINSLGYSYDEFIDLVANSMKSLSRLREIALLNIESLEIKEKAIPNVNFFLEISCEGIFN